jgi:hypothetical protein
MDTKPTTEHGNIELTEAQAEIVGQFNDYAFENPGKTFEEVVLKEFGPGLVSGNTARTARNQR